MVLYVCRRQKQKKFTLSKTIPETGIVECLGSAVHTVARRGLRVRSRTPETQNGDHDAGNNQQGPTRAGRHVGPRRNNCP